MAAIAAEYISRYRWVILALAFLGQTSYAVTSQVIAPLAPLVQRDMGLSKTEVGFFTTAVYYGAWTVLVLGGTLADRFGVRRTSAMGLILSGTLMALMPVTSSFHQAMVLMVAVGLGRGTVAPGVAKAIMDWFAPAARATAMGVKQAGVPIAGVVAASTMPALGLALGWRVSVAAAGLFMAASGAVILLFYRDPARLGAKGLSRGGARGSIRRVMRNRRLWAISTVALFYSGAHTALWAYLALYFVDVVLVASVPEESTRILVAGGYLALSQIGGMFSRIMWGVASDRIFGGRRVVVMAIVGVLSAATCLGMGRMGSGWPLWLLTPAVLAVGLCAIGWGGLYLAAVVETAGPAQTGTGVGLSMSLMQVGNVAGAPLFGLLVDLSGTYQAGWLFVAALFATGALVAGVVARAEGREKNRPQIDAEGRR